MRSLKTRKTYVRMHSLRRHYPLIIFLQCLLLGILLVWTLISRSQSCPGLQGPSWDPSRLESVPTPVKLLAFYYPQFHEIEENSRFWGEGWTEWDNVRRVEKNKWGMETLKPSLDTGYYNLLDYQVRKKQGELLREHGINGLIVHHYWFGNHPVMYEVPLKMLADGEPNMSFFFNWANEPWTKRWDGGNDDMLLDQDYGSQGDWATHFKWLLPFFQSTRYIKVDGAPVFGIYRSDLIPKPMISFFESLARDHGFSGLHMVDVMWRSPQPASWANSVMEFHPNYYTYDFSRFPDLPRKHLVHHRGTFVSWDNAPRHPEDGKGTFSPISHPMIFFEHILLMLHRIHADPNPRGQPNWLAINAFNEWGEGNVLEPSAQFGSGYLSAVKRALELYQGGLALPPSRDLLQTFKAPVEAGRETDESVCVLVRTFHGHVPSRSLFHLGRLLSSLKAQRNPRWVAAVFQTDNTPFPQLDELLEEAQDPRIHKVELPNHVLRRYFSGDAGYIATDAALEQLVESSGACAGMDWVVFTNGDNEYLPWAFSFSNIYDADILSLRFMSRWIFWNNHNQLLRSSREDGHGYSIAHSARCESEYEFGGAHHEFRWEVHAKAECISGSPSVGGTDLGANMFRLSRFVKEQRKFGDYTTACPLCQDGLLIQDLVSQGWSFSPVPSNQKSCHFLHNPSPLTCQIHGGIWFDSPIFSEYGCVTLAEAQSLVSLRAQELDLVHMRRNPFCLRYNLETFQKLVEK